MGMSAFYLGKNGKPASEPENIEVIHRLGTRQDTVNFALDGPGLTLPYHVHGSLSGFL